jgi:hypothetical protein
MGRREYQETRPGMFPNVGKKRWGEARQQLPGPRNPIHHVSPIVKRRCAPLVDLIWFRKVPHRPFHCTSSNNAVVTND